MAKGKRNGPAKGSSPSFLSAVQEAARRAKNAWGAIRGAQPPAPPEAVPPHREETLVGLGDKAADEEEVVTVREEVLKDYRERLVRLHKEYGRAPDVDVLLRELAQVHPGVIRQPVGVAQQILDMLNRDNYSGAQMARVIETDPAIAQALLNHANADWYEEDGAPPLSSLLLAARRIGARGVHAAVMSVVLEGGCVQPGAGFNRIARMVWDHMVRVAPLARQLAHGFGGDPDSGFTLGLCHDVGKLLLFERIADLRKAERRDLAFPGGFLRTALKALHEPLGGLASFAWNMPPEYAAAIASHHRTGSRSERNPLSEAIFIAERLDLLVRTHQEIDLARLWREGGISVPLEEGARLFEEARQTAVLALIEEKRARGELMAS